MVLRHLGIIADGNRRWAKAQGLPTIEGHKKGLSVIKELVGAASKAGIEYITFYVFSTENWGRSADEVNYIMKLAETRILKYAKELAENNARMLILGSKERVSPKLASTMEQAEKLTAGCTALRCVSASTTVASKKSPMRQRLLVKWKARLRQRQSVSIYTIRKCQISIW